MSNVIWHLGGWYGGNFGDCVLQVATQDIFNKGDTHFVSVDNQKTYFSPQLIDKMNSEADMLLVGGGGFIFHRPQDKSRSGWQFNIKTEDIEKIKIPLVVYGIGYNRFPYDQHVFPQKMWESLQAIIDKSAAFSVRNCGTYETLKQHGIDVSKVDVVPDAAVFAKSFSFTHEALNTDKLKIGVNWATDRWDQRFDSVETAHRALDETLRGLKEIALENDAKIYLIEHLMPNELNVANKTILRERFRQRMEGVDHCIVFSEMNGELYPPFDYLAPMFVDIYRQMDMVLGMRGHANIISFSQGTPVLGLGEHNKVAWFLKDVSLLIDQVPYDRVGVKLVVDDFMQNCDTYRVHMKRERARQEIIKNGFVEKAMLAL